MSGGGGAVEGGLIYSFVARGTVVLAEYTEFTGNFPAIAAQCLQKLPSSNNRFTYACDGHTFNFLVRDGYDTAEAVQDEGEGRGGSGLSQVRRWPDSTGVMDRGRHRLVHGSFSMECRLSVIEDWNLASSQSSLRFFVFTDGAAGWDLERYRSL